MYVSAFSNCSPPLNIYYTGQVKGYGLRGGLRHDILVMKIIIVTVIRLISSWSNHFYYYL